MQETPTQTTHQQTLSHLVLEQHHSQLVAQFLGGGGGIELVKFFIFTQYFLTMTVIIMCS